MLISYKIIPLSQLNNSQIENLAHLHHAVMHSLLTDLGLPFVERYYQIACADSSVVGVCAVGADEIPLGWAIGSSKPDQLNGRLREASVWFIAQMLRVLVTRPRLIPQLLISSSSASQPLKRVAIELTYIGVDPSVRKQGMGRDLLKAFILTTQQGGYRSIVLSVEAENEGAIALYTRAGFEIIASFKEGRFNRHRMELIFK